MRGLRALAWMGLLSAAAPAAAAPPAAASGKVEPLRLLAEAAEADAAGRPREALRMLIDAVEGAGGDAEVARLLAGALRRQLARVGGEPVAGPGPADERVVGAGERWALLRSAGGARLVPIGPDARARAEQPLTGPGGWTAPHRVDRGQAALGAGAGALLIDLDPPVPQLTAVAAAGEGGLLLPLGAGSALFADGSGTLQLHGPSGATPLDGPAATPWAVAAAPGLVAAGGAGGELWTWRVGQDGVGPRTEAARLREPVASVAIAEDGHTLVVTTDGLGGPALVDLAGERRVVELAPELRDSIRDDRLVVGGGLAVLAGETDKVSVALLDGRGAVLREAAWGRAHAWPRAVAVGPGASCVALVPAPEQDLDRIRVWDRAGLEARARGEDAAPQELVGHSGPVRALLAGSGELLSGSDDGTVRRWGLRSGAWTQFEVLAGHDGPVRDLVAAGDVVLSLGADGLRQWWRPAADAAPDTPWLGLDGRPVQAPPLPVDTDGPTVLARSGPFALIRDPDAAQVVVERDGGQGDVTRTPFHVYSSTVVGGAFSTDGHLLVALQSGHRMTGTTGIMAIDPERPDELGALIHSEPLDPVSAWVTAFAASPDGRWVLWATTRGAVLLDLRGADLDVGVVDAEGEGADGEAPRHPSAPQVHRLATRGPVLAAAFDAASTWLVTGDLAHDARAWELRRPSAPPVYLGRHADEVVTAAVDGDRALTRSRDGVVRAWPLRTEDAVTLARRVAGPPPGTSPR